MTATPFYLRHAAGRRIRVDATEDVFLVDEIDSYICNGRTSRTLTAQLLPGEQVFAKGELRWELDPEARPKGYRDARMGWVLKPPSHDALLVSTESLAERFLASARFHRTATAWLVAAFVGCQALLNPFDRCRSLDPSLVFFLVVIVVGSWWGYRAAMTNGAPWYEAAVCNSGQGKLDRTTGFEDFEDLRRSPQT